MAKGLRNAERESEVQIPAAARYNKKEKADEPSALIVNKVPLTRIETDTEMGYPLEERQRSPLSAGNNRCKAASNKYFLQTTATGSGYPRLEQLYCPIRHFINKFSG
ncbi:hypothetical protein LJK87_03375 [Paenibacillus sp. P25]|nr:hypothetical protein LJK87_03375 [Paenibacillus sp. P25]